MNPNRRAKISVSYTHLASDAIPIDDAIFLDQYGMSYLDSCFICFRDRADRSGRADFRTFDAFGTTISSLIRYFWLHKCLQVFRRTKAVYKRQTSVLVGASSVAQLTDNLKALQNKVFSTEELQAIESILQ